MSTITATIFNQISPFELELSPGQRVYATAVFQDNLYLAEVYYAAELARDCHRVLRYQPQSNSWQDVYTAFYPGDEAGVHGAESRPSYGLETEMVVFPRQGETPETLYLRFLSGSGVQLLRSEDGEHFQAVESFPGPLSELLFNRCFTIFGDRLYTLPALKFAQEDPEVEDPCLLHVATPAGPEPWQEANTPGFGDDSNQGISQLAVFQDSLYVATVNRELGFQIWQAQTADSLPLNWKLVLNQGAYRFSLNQWVSFMAPFKGDLYLTSGLYLKNAQEQLNPNYPAGFEIVRLYPSGGWDVIVGTPKFSKDGLKVPLSVRGPGFDDPYSCTVECLIAQGDYLYLGTHNLDQFQLWRSQDGEFWDPLVLPPELGTYYQLEVQAAFSTSWGLVLVLDCLEPTGARKLQVWLL